MDAPKISISDLKEIFHNKSFQRTEKINKLKVKLDQLIEDGLWEPCDVLPQVDNSIENSRNQRLFNLLYLWVCD